MLVLICTVFVSIRLLLDGIELLAGVDLLHYLPYINTESFLSYGKETLTEAFPLGFHFFNVFQHKYVKNVASVFYCLFLQLGREELAIQQKD